MKRQLLYIISLLLALAFSVSANAQETKPTDSVAITKKSGLEIAFDYGKLLTLASDFESKWSVGVGYRYKSKLLLDIWAGMATLEPKNAYENGSYKSEGIYGSIGLNYLISIDAKNLLYLGVRYGMSMYEDSYTYEIGSPIWATFSGSGAHKDLQADWFAVSIGSEKELKIKNLFLGGKVSLRFINSYDKFEPIDTYAIPGYGRTSDGTVPALNVYIKYLL